MFKIYANEEKQSLGKDILEIECKHYEEYDIFVGLQFFKIKMNIKP